MRHIRETANDSPLSDEAIIALFYERDESAISESNRKYGRYLLTVAYNILGNDPDCEECLNDTFLNAWNSIPPAKPHSLGAYLTKIIRGIAINRYNRDRRERRIPPEAVDSFSELESVLAVSDWEREDEAKLIGEVISRYLRGINRRKRYIFMARYYAVHPIGDIAEKLGISESAVKKALAAMKKDLRKELEKEGIEV